MTAEQPAAMHEIFCAGCGYNLRGLSSDRCPECGLAIDRESLRRSQLPWPQRRSIGRWRAYWRTVFATIFRPARIAAEMNLPASHREAWRFRLVTILIAWVPLAAALAVLAWKGGDINLFEGIPDMSTALQWPAWQWIIANDVVLPFAVGAVTPGVLPAAALLFLLLGTGGGMYFFRAGTLDPAQRDRAVALSQYGCAWLSLMPLALLIAAGGVGLMMLAETMRDRLPLQIAGAFLEFVPLALFLIAGMGYLRLYRLCTRAGAGWTVLFLIAIPLLWALAALLSFGVLCWTVGYFRLLIASLAR
ncbi:MAG TPA: hypothetical protein VIL86_19880 [Tepidisphaeraceae bacterium]